MIEVNEELANKYYGKDFRHKDFWKCLDTAFHVQFHGDGYYLPPFTITPPSGSLKKVEFEPAEQTNPYFVRNIDTIRPSESNTILSYRRTQYLPKTKNPVSKVYNVLRKIMKSSDWAVNWPKEEINTPTGKKSTKPSTSIPEKESLQVYCEETFPFFDSIENWFYQVGMRGMLYDPNGIICVMPLDWPTKETENEFLRPFPYIIPSKDIFEYKEGEMAIFKGPNVHEYTDKEGNTRQSMCMLIATKYAMYEAYKEVNNGYDPNDIIINEVWSHNMGYMPCWKLGGEITAFNGSATVYESFLAPMLPDLDDAARMFSDHQAEIIQHIHSTMWYYSNQKCRDCDGTGYVNKKGTKVVCSSCEGGYMAFSPFNHYKVTPKKNAIGQETDNPPTPPLGYIIKPIDMCKLQEEMIKDRIYRSLSAVNMEYLGEAPIVQSGTAKAYDQDAGNAFIGRVAYHIVEHILNNVFYFVNEIRYKTILTDDKKRESLLPTINIPDKFDFITENMLEEKMINLKKADVSPEIIAGAEEEYISKKYYNNPEKLKTWQLKNLHDPFKYASHEDIINMETASVIPKIDAVKSIYIDDFFEQILHEEKGVFEMEYDEVEELLNQKAQAKMEEMSAQNQVEKLSEIPDMYNTGSENNGGSNGEFGEPVNAEEEPANPKDVPLRKKNKRSNQKPGPVHNNLRFS